MAPNNLSHCGVTTMGARLKVLIKSMLAGALATAADFGTFVVLTHLFSAPSRWANIAGLIVGAVLNFLGNRQFAFRAYDGDWFKQAQWYTLVTAVALGLNAGLFHLAVDIDPQWPAWLVRVVVSNAVYFAFIFPMLKRRVFRPPSGATPQSVAVTG